MRKPKKIAGYLRALEMMGRGMSQYEACDKAGISRMTFNKYREMFGEEIAPNKVEVLPKEKAPVKVAQKSRLDQLIEENNVMERNLQLKKELGLIQ